MRICLLVVKMILSYKSNRCDVSTEKMGVEQELKEIICLSY